MLCAPQLHVGHSGTGRAGDTKLRLAGQGFAYDAVNQDNQDRQENGETEGAGRYAELAL